MALPKIAEVGRLTRDAEMRFTPSGSAVLTVPLAFNSRKFNKDTQEWEDGDTLYVDGSVWGDKAEALTEVGLTRGTTVLVSGRLRTESWETDGQKRSKVALLIDEVAPVVRAARAERAQGSNPVSAAGDPWADEAPF